MAHCKPLEMHTLTHCIWQHPHTDYKHRDAGTLLDEIDEFFSYVESANALESYRSDFNDDFGKGKSVLLNTVVFHTNMCWI